jgi:hypothetical protein
VSAELTVVLPTLNEEGALRQVLSRPLNIIARLVLRLLARLRGVLP